MKTKNLKIKEAIKRKILQVNDRTQLKKLNRFGYKAISERTKIAKRLNITLKATYNYE